MRISLISSSRLFDSSAPLCDLRKALLNVFLCAGRKNAHMIIIDVTSRRIVQMRAGVRRVCKWSWPGFMTTQRSHCALPLFRRCRSTARKRSSADNRERGDSVQLQQWPVQVEVLAFIIHSYRYEKRLWYSNSILQIHVPCMATTRLQPLDQLVTLHHTVRRPNCIHSVRAYLRHPWLKCL